MIIISIAATYSIVWAILYFKYQHKYKNANKWVKCLFGISCPFVLFPIVFFLLAGLVIFEFWYALPSSEEDAKRKYSHYQTDKQLEMCEAFRGIDFPEFTPVDTTFSAAFLMEEYMVEHRMRFKKVPDIKFYKELDEACLRDSCWSKSKNGQEYSYCYLWTLENLHKGPDGWDYLMLTIRRGEREFELEYGTE